LPRSKHACPSFFPIAIFSLGLLGFAPAATAQDADLCLSAAERVDAGEKLTDAEKKEAHEACLRALSATGSVLQKYQFQEADFAITGTHHKF
jgi:hypothetical protein